MFQVPQPLQVGQRVSAMHPEAHVLATGSVLTVDVPQYECAGCVLGGEVVLVLR